ncbi:MAG: hypothetical protein ACR2OJ_06315 [Hyphomicrobiales bacterium]
MAWLKGIFGSSDEASDAQRSEPSAPPLTAPPEQSDTQSGDIPNLHEREVYAARDAYWDTIGASDPDVLTYVINPMFQGAPAWPNVRQTYRLVRTENTLIIASDGLSDPYPDEEKNAEHCGFGMEVFIEIPGLQSVPQERIRQSWAFAAVEMFAQNVANFGGIIPQLTSQAILSMELPLRRAPKGWMKENGGLGALIGMPVDARSTEISGIEPTPILVVPLTLLRPSEVDECGERGAQAREEIAQKLIANGSGHLTDVARERVF